MSLSTEQIAKIKAGYKKGLTAKQIATSLGITLKAVYREASKLKLKHARFYSKKEISLIKEMIRLGNSTDAIAEVLSRPLPGLERKICELGFKSGFFYSDKEKEEIRTLREQGLNATEIANKLANRSARSVGLQLKAMGLGNPHSPFQLKKRRERNMSDEQIKLFCDYLKGCTLGDEPPIPAEEICTYWNIIAKEKGYTEVTRDKVEYWLKKLKLPYVSGKKVKLLNPKIHKLRVKKKLKTLEATQSEKDKIEQARLNKLQESLCFDPNIKLSFCPRCEKFLPIHNEFFYYKNTESGLIPVLDICIFCSNKYRRRINHLRSSGASDSEIKAFRREESRKARENKRCHKAKIKSSH